MAVGSNGLDPQDGHKRRPVMPDDPVDPTDGGADPEEEEAKEAPKDPVRTPLYRAMNAERYRPAQSYVNGYNDLVKQVNDNPDAPAYKQMLDKYDPTLIDLCGKVIARSKNLAEQLLQNGMMRRGGNFTAVAANLSDNQKWLE